LTNCELDTRATCGISTIVEMTARNFEVNYELKVCCEIFPILKKVTKTTPYIKVLKITDL